ncbi:MerR family transcriptional regulator [Olivibacter domesticus]
MEIHRFILKKEEEETIYRDANYVLDRVGISKSTLLRYQGRGMITVAKIVNKKKLYRDLDVERLRKIYWGVGE